MFANCILFVTFCSMGTLVRRNKTWHYSAQKVMEFGLLMRDIPVYVSCKFEMYFFKITLVQVISENVRIAFLYVLSIFIRDLTSILKTAVRDSCILKNRSPRQNFAVPLYKFIYPPHFLKKKINYFYSALLWDCTSYTFAWYHHYWDVSSL